MRGKGRGYLSLLPSLPFAKQFNKIEGSLKLITLNKSSLKSEEGYEDEIAAIRSQRHIIYAW